MKTNPIDWRRVVSTACLKVDWTHLATATLRSPELAAMVGEAFRVIGHSIERDIANAEVAPASEATAAPIAEEPQTADHIDGAAHPAEEPAVVVDEAAANAAEVLGVAPTANEDEIRAALRARLASSRLHPDHGGDGDKAKELIAAKNLLIERARATRA